MCMSTHAQVSPWLIFHKVFLANPSQVQWDLRCYIIPNRWTHNRNLQPVHLPVDILDMSILIWRCRQREMYSWNEGDEYLFCMIT